MRTQASRLRERGCLSLGNEQPNNCSNRRAKRARDRFNEIRTIRKTRTATTTTATASTPWAGGKHPPLDLAGTLFERHERPTPTRMTKGCRRSHTVSGNTFFRNLPETRQHAIGTGRTNRHQCRRKNIATTASKATSRSPAGSGCVADCSNKAFEPSGTGVLAASLGAAQGGMRAKPRGQQTDVKSRPPHGHRHSQWTPAPGVAGSKTRTINRGLLNHQKACSPPVLRSGAAGVAPRGEMQRPISTCDST